MTLPAVSVLMTVYNREKYLSEAVESILNQTFTDFEFVIVDDGSTDRSLAILKKFAKLDKRIILLQNETNQGIVKSVTTGIHNCHGQFIARMDSDDVSLPTRLKKEYEYLTAHPKISAVGTGFEFMDQEGIKTGGYVIRPVDPIQTRYEMYYHCMLHNPTTMSRSDFYKLFNERNLERTNVANADYAFWMRKNSTCLYSNIPEKLFLYRLHPGRISSTHMTPQRDTAVTASKLAFEELLGRNISFDSIKSFYFSERVEEKNPRIVKQGIKIMVKGYKRFLRTNTTTAVQRSEIQKFTYEKVKSVTAKYRHSFSVLIDGYFGMLILMPARFFSDLFAKIDFHLSRDLKQVKE